MKEELFSKKEKIISEMKSEETIKTRGTEIEVEKKEKSVKDTKEEIKEEKREQSKEKKLIERKEEEKEIHEEKEVEEKQLYEKISRQEHFERPTTVHQTTVADDGTVKEVISVETRSTSSVVEPLKQPKEEFLQKLGEELGKLAGSWGRKNRIKTEKITKRKKRENLKCVFITVKAN